jgi:uncharacterized protein YkwD
MMQRLKIHFALGYLLAFLFSGEVLAQNNTGVAKTPVDKGAAAVLISELRRSQGLGPVTVDTELNHFAHAHARAMAAHNQMGHDVGTSFAERRRSIRARIVAENLGAAYQNVSEAIIGWRNSPSHNANMLDPAVTRIGIAAVDAPGSDYYRVFWALVLASP